MGSRIAGVDEAGRGPWAGPVVAAAVVLRRRRLSVRIDDSKRLTASQRLRAFEAISENAEVGVGIVCAQEIDRRNILQATLLAMAEAIQQLPRVPKLVLVDGRDAPPSCIPCRPIVHGDQRSYVISCASIVAKVLRDRLMTFYDTLYPHYQFSRHKGYGTTLHRQALQMWGPCILHRLTFNPVAQSSIDFASPHHLMGFAAGKPPLRSSLLAIRQVAETGLRNLSARPGKHPMGRTRGGSTILTSSDGPSARGAIPP